MRDKLFLLVCLVTLLFMPTVVMVSWAKRKCDWLCITLGSPLCPGPCIMLPSQVPTVADACVHIPFDLDGLYPVDHSFRLRLEDSYVRQCVPCDVPEGQREPQFMQWLEIRLYWCDVICIGWFVTTKVKDDPRNPEEPVAVPFPCPVEE